MHNNPHDASSIASGHLSVPYEVRPSLTPALDPTILAIFQQMLGTTLQSLIPTQPSSVLPQQTSSTNKDAPTEALIEMKNMSKLQADAKKSASDETCLQCKTKVPQDNSFVKFTDKPTGSFTTWYNAVLRKSL